MKTEVYYNRYGDKIVFEEEGDIVTMSGYNPDWLRVGYANKKEEDSTTGPSDEIIDMIDPSGGPYITVGSDLRLFFKDGKERLIKHIEIKHKHIEFKIERNEKIVPG